MIFCTSTSFPQFSLNSLSVRWIAGSYMTPTRNRKYLWFATLEWSCQTARCLVLSIFSIFASWWTAPLFQQVHPPLLSDYLKQFWTHLSKCTLVNFLFEQQAFTNLICFASKSTLSDNWDKHGDTHEITCFLSLRLASRLSYSFPKKLRNSLLQHGGWLSSVQSPVTGGGDCCLSRWFCLLALVNSIRLSMSK